jgi:hypothetical protein
MATAFFSGRFFYIQIPLYVIITIFVAKWTNCLATSLTTNAAMDNRKIETFPFIDFGNVQIANHIPLPRCCRFVVDKNQKRLDALSNLFTFSLSG